MSGNFEVLDSTLARWEWCRLVWEDRSVFVSEARCLIDETPASSDVNRLFGSRVLCSELAVEGVMSSHGTRV